MAAIKPFSVWLYRSKSVGATRYIVLTVAVVSSGVWGSVGGGRAVVYFPVCSPSEHRVCTEEEFWERFVEDV